jgi:hypothetical protein
MLQVRNNPMFDSGASSRPLASAARYYWGLCIFNHAWLPTNIANIPSVLGVTK